MSSIYVFDPTTNDALSKVRGVGRYLQILKENLVDEFTFSDKLLTTHYSLQTTFINPFFELLKPPLTTKRIAKKQIAIIHDLIRIKYPKNFPIGFKGKFNIFLNKHALKDYDIIVTDSAQSKKNIVKLLKIEDHRVKVIYPCLPKIFLSSTNYSRPTTNYCLYVGDITWNKNLANLARAIKMANITCVFVGKNFTPNVRVADLQPLQHPELQEFRDFLKEVKDDKRFIFKGYTPDEELIKLYQQARLNILISRDEGFGFSYLEAASQHTPSVLSDIPVFNEIAKDTAIFADPNDPRDIANKIYQYYKDSDLRNSIGEKAYERSHIFGCDKFKEDWLQTVKS